MTRIAFLLSDVDTFLASKKDFWGPRTDSNGLKRSFVIHLNDSFEQRNLQHLLVFLRSKEEVC